MTNGPFRNGKVHVKAAKCSTCIFRPGNLMHLERGRVDDMVAHCLAAESAITCHQTLSDDQALCRGFVDVHGRDVASVWLAYALGNVEEVAA